MESKPKTHAPVEELVAYLPKLQSLEGRYVEQWNPPYYATPAYHPLVEEFFYRVARTCPPDEALDPHRAERDLHDPQVLHKADLGTLRSLLGWCARSEQGRPGIWEQLLQNGVLFSLLQRLRAVAQSNGNGARGRDGA
ncbi:hypothetical protein SAMN02746041_00793 [Desulfacinum hydrothermale DSM 13146]|uniref:Uncharacterized protein n=1 Tax=Desulfacinum hydrothermale DSM 13146 TaxID=1121390 RepID=A0A1W1X8A4_9BACT|nr:DUF6508 domain-containing protein [Desulfacinum hydrothermale]SMC20057.1 hypothetical protein SAMN02746041_00793 [Desulfacinum hydrothermale DSM 13146]